MKVARYTASSLEDVVRNTIENQPYTAVAIALGLDGFSDAGTAPCKMRLAPQDCHLQTGQFWLDQEKRASAQHFQLT